MDTLTLPYRYLSGDDTLVTEYENIGIDHEDETIRLSFGPVGMEDGGKLQEYRDSPEYLTEPDQETVRRRLPEIGLLEDNPYQDDILSLLSEDCPDSYWEEPASGSGEHHPPDERGPHGQWIHTKRMIRAYDHLSRSAQEMEDKVDDPLYAMDERDRQEGLMAALVHDIHKFGPDGTAATAASDHDLTAAKYVREETDLPDKVAETVEAHNGPWYDGKAPEDETEMLVHFGDMLVADTASETLLQEPTPALKFAQMTDELLRYDEELANYDVERT